MGVSHSELFLAFGSYFRAIDWCHSPHFHRRWHKLMVEYIWRDYPPCRAFSLRGKGFLFSLFLSPGISQCSLNKLIRLNIYYVSVNMFNVEKILLKSCITDLKSIILLVPLETSLRCPLGFSRVKPPLPPKTREIAKTPANPPETGRPRVGYFQAQCVLFTLL